MAKDKKKGLGMGLDALFGEEITEETKRPAGVTELPIAKIEPREDQPRKHFDEQSLLDLSESIEKHGLIQPITVRELESGFYQIVAGERRWRAARKAGLEKVPVHIINADERKAMEMALVENLQREDLNPIEEALGYQTLQNEYGLTQDTVAKTVGRSRPAVANALRLLSLSEPVRELVESGMLSAGHARTLLPLEDPEAQLDAANAVIAKDMSVRRTEAYVAELLKEKKTAKAMPASAVDYLGECARELEEALGRRVRLTQRRKGGRIELEFYDADDREALIEALKSLPKPGRKYEK